MNKFDNMMNQEINFKNGSQGDYILTVLEKIKDISNSMVYNTEGACEYLKVGKSVLDKYRQNGELSYSKLGQTYVYTQQDLNDLLMRNKVRYIS